jgi:hypothetical protein
MKSTSWRGLDDLSTLEDTMANIVIKQALPTSHHRAIPIQPIREILEQRRKENDAVVYGH